MTYIAYVPSTLHVLEDWKFELRNLQGEGRNYLLMEKTWRKQTAVYSCSLNCVLAVWHQCPQSHLTLFSPLTSHMLTDKERWWKTVEVTMFFCTPDSTWDAISSDSAGICWGLQASWRDWLANGSWSLSILRRIWASADSSFCTVPMAGSRFGRAEKPGDLRTPP